MAYRTEIRNLSVEAITMPYPFRGVLRGGDAAVVSRSKAAVVAAFGGSDAISGVFAVRDVPLTNSLTGHDVSYTCGGQTLHPMTMGAFDSVSPALIAATAADYFAYQYAHGSDLEVFVPVQIPSDYVGDDVEITPLYSDDAAGSDAVIEVSYMRMLDGVFADASDYVESVTPVVALVTMTGKGAMNFVTLSLDSDSLQAGDWIVIRFRRLGSHGLDGIDRLDLCSLGVQYTPAIIS